MKTYRYYQYYSPLLGKIVGISNYSQKIPNVDTRLLICIYGQGQSNMLQYCLAIIKRFYFCILLILILQNQVIEVEEQV